MKTFKKDANATVWLRSAIHLHNTNQVAAVIMYGSELGAMNFTCQCWTERENEVVSVSMDSAARIRPLLEQQFSIDKVRIGPIKYLYSLNNSGSFVQNIFLGLVTAPRSVGMHCQ